MCVLMHVHVLVDVNVRRYDNVHSCMDTCTCTVCAAPTIVVGAWPIVGTLWQLFEYYYYCSTCTYDCTSTYMYIHVTLTCAYMYLEKTSPVECVHTHCTCTRVYVVRINMILAHPRHQLGI